MILSAAGWIAVFGLLSVVFEWLDAGTRERADWTGAFGERVDRQRDKPGVLKKRPSNDEWIKSKHGKANG